MHVKPALIVQILIIIFFLQKAKEALDSLSAIYYAVEVIISLYMENFSGHKLSSFMTLETKTMQQIRSWTIDI